MLDKAWILLILSTLCDVALAAGSSEYTVHVTYEEIYDIIFFLLVAFVAGRITKAMGMPSLVGEMITGFTLGPPLADIVPYAEALVLIGEIGLIGLILEAGVELDVAQLRQTGTRALAIGFTGSALPLCLGIGIGHALGQDLKGALAIGAAFSPTSLGVAASALGSGGMLNTPVGQLIVASCVIDDVLGLVILSLFEVLVKDDAKLIEYFIPVISSFGFLIVLGLLGVTVFPRMIRNQFLPFFPKKYQMTAMFSMMAFFTMAYLPLLHYTKASYLTGAFLAGATFSQLPDAHHAFLHSTHQVMEWLLRVFFAASIGFQVPTRLFSDPNVIAIGFAFYACVAIKFPLGFYVPKFETVPKGSVYNPGRRDFLVTGMSMTCRGEFSFIIAAFALSKGVIDPKMYASVVWAVLLSCTVNPLILLNIIAYFKRQHKKHLELTKSQLSDNKDGKMPVHFHIHLETSPAWGLAERLSKEINELGLVVVDHRTTNNRGLDATVVSDFYVRDDSTRIELPTISKQKEKADAIKKVESNNSLTRLVKHNSMKDLAGLDLDEEMPPEAPSQLNDIEQDTLKVLTGAIKDEILIEQRAATLQKQISEKLKDLGIIDHSICAWNPWDWSAALRSIMMTRKDGKPADMDFFMGIFNTIDADGSGAVDEDELFDALKSSGIEVTRDGLKQMIAVVDENNDGEISKEEWKEAIQFFLDTQDDETEVTERRVSTFIGFDPKDLPVVDC